MPTRRSSGSRSSGPNGASATRPSAKLGVGRGALSSRSSPPPSAK
jgi:hypothetical protein